MARIPLYNQGRGTTQQLATGSLSPSANVSAFTAPGLASASFADSAGQIAFNFGQAEQRKQDEDAIETNKIAFRQASADFRRNNRTDNYEEFKDKYAAWQQGWIVNNTRNFKSRRKRLVINAINPIASVENLRGQTDAFNLSERNGTIAMNDTLKSNVNIIASYPENSFESQAAIKENQDIFKRNESLGRNLIYTPDGAKSAVIDKTFKNDIDDATNIEQLNNIEAKIDKSTLPVENILSLKGFVNRKKDYYQTGRKIELDDKVADLEANALTEGIESSQIESLQNEYIAVYGEIEGKVNFNSAKKRLVISKDVYSIYKGVEFSNFATKQNAVTQAFIDYENAPLDQKAEKLQVAAGLSKKLNEDAKQISNDPVQFILNKNRGREFTSYARVTEQKKLGLTRKQVKLYTNNEMAVKKSEYDSLNTANEKKAYLLNLKNQNQGLEEYLMPQMFENGFGYVENILMLNDTSPFNESLIASKNFKPQKELAAELKSDFQEIAVLVTGEFQDFRKSIQGDPMIGSVLSANGRSGSADQIQTVIINLAKYLKSQDSSVDNDTIVDNAMSVINNNYDIEKINDGFVRIPKRFGDDGTISIVNRLKRVISSRDFVAKEVLLQGKLQPDAYRKLSSFTWVTNDDETGVRLINSNAGGSSVLGLDSKPIELSFEEILVSEKAIEELAREQKDAFNEELRKRKYGGRQIK